MNIKQMQTDIRTLSKTRNLLFLISIAFISIYIAQPYVYLAIIGVMSLGLSIALEFDIRASKRRLRIAKVVERISARTDR